MLRHFLAGLLSVSIAAAAAFAGSSDEQLPPHLISAPHPAFPYDFRPNRHDLEFGLGCKAILEVDYHSGAVKDVKIQESTGSVILDQVAINTLHRWKFEPDTTLRAE